MIKAIMDELQLRKEEWHGKDIKTIYFGGGTPSLMEFEHIVDILNLIRENSNVSRRAEITLEVNPDDLNDNEKAYEFFEAGINRLSVGIQSLDDETLEWMNRNHDAVEGLASLYLAREVGFINISADLIYGHPYLTPEKLTATLEELVSFDILHLSAYALTVEPRTVLAHYKEKGKYKELSDEEINEHFEILNSFMQKNEFVHYEVSNWGQVGFISEHNSSYWKSIDYIGVGPSAHSFNGSKRRWNIKNNQQYLKKIREGKNDYFEEEVLSKQNSYNEYLMTRFRTIWGVEKQQIAAFGIDAEKEFQKQLNLSSFSKYIQENDKMYYLDEKDWVWADRVASDLFWID